MQAEYKRRHDEIWPEMKRLMERAGIRNYSIWNTGDDLFSYFETDDYDTCCKIIAESEIKKKWDRYMSDLITFEPVQQTGQMENLELMFLFP